MRFLEIIKLYHRLMLDLKILKIPRVIFRTLGGIAAALPAGQPPAAQLAQKGGGGSAQAEAWAMLSGKDARSYGNP